MGLLHPEIWHIKVSLTPDCDGGELSGLACLIRLLGPLLLPLAGASCASCVSGALAIGCCGCCGCAEKICGEP